MLRYFTFFLLITGIVVSGFSTPVKRTVSQVEADISAISTQVTALDKAIVAFPNSGGTLTQALAIHTSAQNLLKAINTATTDTKATTGPVAESDARTILNSVEAFEPTILDALKQIVAKKPAFDAIPLGNLSALALQDLKALASATSAFESALIALCPADLVSEATNVKNTIDSAFTTAIQAYS